MYYFESSMGCGLRAAPDIDTARKNVREEVGSANYKFVRRATKSEISWVEAMGGRVPSLT